MTDKIYCGSGKERRFRDGGFIIGVTLDIETLQKSFREHGFITAQGKKKIKINVSARREIDQYGNTHYVTIDTWKPDTGAQQQTATRTQPATTGKPTGYGGHPPQAAGQEFRNYQPPTSTGNGQFEDDIPF